MGTSTGYNLPTSGNWPDAKRAVTTWGQSGISNPGQLGHIMSSYVRAPQGDGIVAHQSTQTTIAAARIGALVSSIRGDGLSRTLENAGLSYLVGRPALEVIRGIRDYLTGSGSSLDDELVREAFDDFQEEVIGQHETYEELDAALSRLALASTVSETIERFFGYLVYKKFKHDFSERLLKAAGGVRQANRLLRDIKDYIFDTLRTKLHGRNLNHINWQGREGIQMAEDIHASVWRVFGET